MSDKKTKKMKNMSKARRCEFSGESVGNKPVVLVKNVLSYVRKMGYLVSNIKFLIFFMFLFMFPFVSAFDSQYNFDLDSRINIVISVCVLVGASVLAFMRGNYSLLSSGLFVVLGFLFLFNGLNVVLSFIVIALGVTIAFK